MLSISDDQLGSMRDHLVSNFISESIVFLRSNAPEFSNSLNNKTLKNYVNACLAFCDEFKIGTPSNVHKIMLWNIEHSFLEGSDCGAEILLSEFAFSEDYRIERLAQLLKHKTQLAWRLFDDL